MVFSSINLSTFSFIHLLPVTIFFGEEECPHNSERDKEGRNSFLNGRSDGGTESILECQILNWWKHLCSWFTLSWSLYYKGQNMERYEIWKWVIVPSSVGCAQFHWRYTHFTCWLYPRLHFDNNIKCLKQDPTNIVSFSYSFCKTQLTLFNLWPSQATGLPF